MSAGIFAVLGKALQSRRRGGICIDEHRQVGLQPLEQRNELFCNAEHEAVATTSFATSGGAESCSAIGVAMLAIRVLVRLFCVPGARLQGSWHTNSSCRGSKSSRTPQTVPSDSHECIRASAFLGIRYNIAPRSKTKQNGLFRC